MRISRKPINRHLYSQLLLGQQGGANLRVFRGNIQQRKLLKGGVNLRGIVSKLIKPTKMIMGFAKNPTYRKLGLNLAKSAVKQIPKLITKKKSAKQAMKSILKDNKGALVNVAKQAVMSHLLSQKGGTIGGRKIRVVNKKQKL
jgi:hypothetical protein